MQALLHGAVLLLLVLIACGSPQPPRAVRPVVAEGDFTLYVSNQSFAIDPVDIDVLLDGALAITGDFEVGSQHSWHEFRFQLGLGEHDLRAHSQRGQAELSRKVPISGRHWAVINYWYYPPTHYDPTPRQFSFLLSDQPLSFD